MIITIAATSQFSIFTYFILLILNFLINCHGCTIIGMLISSTRSRIIEIAEMGEISIFTK